MSDNEGVDIAPVRQRGLENLTREGQLVGLDTKLAEEPTRRGPERPPALPTATDLNGEAVTFRLMESRESAALSELFRLVYGSNYVHEYVYHFNELKAMIEARRLISVVASLPDGRLVGHIGLLKWNDTPAVYKLCLGLVDPALTRHGIFSRILALVMDLLNQMPAQYCFCELVTNHVFAQQCVARYHPVELALLIGCQSRVTQADLECLGLGRNPRATDRYSLLYSVFPCVAQPFGQEIELPKELGNTLGFLLEPLNLGWSAASRSERLPPVGEYRAELKPTQKAVTFRCRHPGRQAVQYIKQEWRRLLRHGYQYAAVDVPAGSAGIGELYDTLAEEGFFAAGFVPWKHSAQLGLRFQALGPVRVDFEEISLFTETAKRLLTVVREDHAKSAR